MVLSILVTNQPPATDDAVDKQILDLFQAYIQRTQPDQTYPPFCHQAEVFRQINTDQEVCLIAGTAAGKTLAVAVPLFHKLQTGRIRKILLMYPTIALMDDQRRVMDRLAEITGLKVGLIRGGMSRSELIKALNQQVILATPDAVYWFFQKNIKYSGLLLYGLAIADEWVLDEAHLFNGLMLQNMRCLKERIHCLSQQLGRTTRWHILTATPTPELRTFANGKQVNGASKCGNVQVTFLPPPTDDKQRTNGLKLLVDEALANNRRKVLLVLNAASDAHRLFSDMKHDNVTLSPDQWFRFGWLPWKEFRDWLQTNELSEAVVSLETWLNTEEPIPLIDLPHKRLIPFPTDKIIAGLSEFLETNARKLTELAQEVGGKSEALAAGMSKEVKSRGKVLRALWNVIAPGVQVSQKVDTLQAQLHLWIKKLTDQLDDDWGDVIEDKLPNVPALRAAFVAAGMPKDLVDLIIVHLKYQVTVTPDEVGGIRPGGSVMENRPIHLRWLTWKKLLPDDKLRTMLNAKLRTALEQQVLHPKPSPYISTWVGTDIPVILYSGKMSRHARDGLIELFGELDRAVLVSTPASEVGVDFDAEELITEECDGNGFLQRFGRVGRSGNIGRVTVLLRNQSVLSRLRTFPPEMSRADFSHKMIDPEYPTSAEHSIFPARSYVPDSPLVGAIHWLINSQIGAIGKTLNDEMFNKAPDVLHLARAMQAANVPFRYGLRGTLPEISLYSDVGGDPFYVLKRVCNDNLYPSHSPFAAAQARVHYGRFIYMPSAWNIGVDWEKTIDASTFLFYKMNGMWQVVEGTGVVRDYLNIPVMLNKQYDLMKNLWLSDPERAEKFLQEHRSIPMFAQFARFGKAILLHGTEESKLLLGQGTVFLKRWAQDGAHDVVETAVGEPVVLSNQMWLLLFGNKDKTFVRLAKCGLLPGTPRNSLEELHIDKEGEHVIIIEKLVGACLYAYERLSDVG